MAPRGTLQLSSEVDAAASVAESDAPEVSLVERRLSVLVLAAAAVVVMSFRGCNAVLTPYERRYLHS